MDASNIHTSQPIFPTTCHIGNGHLLLELKDVTTSKSFWVGSYQTYPLSWPLLFDLPSKLPSSSFVGKIKIKAYLVAKPRHQILSANLSSSILSPFNIDAFIRAVIPPQTWYDDDNKEIFDEEIPKFPKSTCQTEPYVRDKYRYRILFIKGDIESGRTIPLSIVDLITIVGENSPEVILHLDKKHKPEDFVNGTFIIFDAIYVAETSALDYQEFLQSKISSSINPKILVFASYPYSPLKTRLNDFLSGKTSRWVEEAHLSTSGTKTGKELWQIYNEKAVPLKSILKIDSVPTFWIGCFEKVCKLDSKSYNMDCFEEEHKRCIINPIAYPSHGTSVGKLFGITTDHILYSLPSLPAEIKNEKNKQNYIDQVTEFEKETNPNFRELYHSLNLYLSEQKEWAQKKNIDLSKYFSDHLALDATFYYHNS